MRSKLRLQLEDLRIDSFVTTPVEKPKGTVFGEQCTCYTNCTCPGCPTCDASCNGTCGDTCQASCGGTCDNACATVGAGYTCYIGCTQSAGDSHCGPYACN